ncbi:hypothetical protein PGTUg99_008184 [Puccinia graminis f. sp. tritici]|uniref:Uncharacterized protein n=1 Tax=Puccinia graminis f. sp. tritici TaxID=56615 RepID=A0A5B0PVV4_PUCGR|nr:hypothetical protein PGTUg99_008184 [Puccinia graminis f. sp. tritici]
MHHFLNFTSIILVHIHFVLGSFNLDHTVSSNAASERQRNLEIAGDTIQHPSKLQQNTNSVDSPLGKSAHFHPQESPSMVLPEKSTSLGASIPDGFRKGRKRLSGEEIGFQTKGDSEIHWHTSKKLGVDPNSAGGSHVRAEGVKNFPVLSDHILHQQGLNEINAQKQIQNPSVGVMHQESSYSHQEGQVKSIKSILVKSEKFAEEFSPRKTFQQEVNAPNNPQNLGKPVNYLEPDLQSEQNPIQFSGNVMRSSPINMEPIVQQHINM